MGSSLSSRVKLVRDQRPNQDIFPENLTCFSLKSIRKATNNFSIRVRMNAFISCYKGTLEDGSEVIIKSYKNINRCINFNLMVKIMSGIKHRNVINLIGYCIQDDDHIMLVHELVGNYSLYQLLFSNDSVTASVDEVELTWPRRVSICHGIARGLDYLHNGISPCVIHRDVKPDNIFIDRRFNPKFVDFEVSCLLENGESHHSGPIAGTVGYLDPEYLLTGNCSEKTDVYSFGITLLEIISGMKNMQFMQDDEGAGLVDRTWDLRDNHRILDIVDPKLSEFSADEVLRFINVALLCVQSSSELRPSMSEVRRMLLMNGYDFSEMVFTRPRQLLQLNNDEEQSDNSSNYED